MRRARISAMRFSAAQVASRRWRISSAPSVATLAARVVAANATARITMPDSRRATCASPGRKFTAASARTIPVIATTTRTSIRVKPLIPITDVGRTAFASARTVGPEAEDVDLAADPRAQVLVVASPRILRQPLEVAALFPVAGHWIGRGPLHQGTQSLVRRPVAAVVEAIKLQRLRDRPDVRLRRHAPRLVGPVHDPRHHDRRQEAQDRHHHHELHWRESALPNGVDPRLVVRSNAVRDD